MASQMVMIEETIVNLKRALARERRDQDAYDEPITQPTNRGNKTRINSRYVHEGSLGIMNGEDFYRKKVEHAGYTRHILQYNPARYDSEGDELDEDDSDATADAEAAEENPYSGISLETLLAPLRHPSELPDHPSLSEPYKNKAILHMVNLVDKRLRQERYALWQAKKVHRQLLGDAPWIPCGAVEKPQDRAIFEPAFLLPKELQPPSSDTQDNLETPASRSSMLRSTAQGHDSRHARTANPNSSNDVSAAGDGGIDRDTEMRDTEMRDAVINGNNVTDIQMEDVNSLLAIADSGAPEQGRLQSELDQRQNRTDFTVTKKSEQALDNEGVDKSTEKDLGGPDGPMQQGTFKSELETENALNRDPMAEEGSPEPPRRMTTRAQANQVAQPNDGSQPASPAGEEINGAEVGEDDISPHPLYQFPSIRIDRNCGLPPMEAEETRHLLWAYIQKQGETVRLFADILEMLRKAYRMKENVLEWCKAEGHIGEMSDGEDWYDREKWLPEGEDLKKGADEEEVEVEEGRAGGKRGRRRA